MYVVYVVYVVCGVCVSMSCRVDVHELCGCTPKGLCVKLGQFKTQSQAMLRYSTWSILLGRYVPWV